jgi:hypothetical protein
MHTQPLTSLPIPGSPPGMTESVRQQTGAEQGVRQDLPVAGSPHLSAIRIPGVWRGTDWQPAPALPQVWPSGHAALDAELPGGGWPGNALIQLRNPRTVMRSGPCCCPRWPPVSGSMRLHSGIRGWGNWCWWRHLSAFCPGLAGRRY